MKNPKDQDQAEKSALRYELFDNLFEGIQVIGFDWRYRYINNAAAAHGHTTPDALLGKTMMEAYPGIEETPLATQIEKTLTERVYQRLENKFTYPDGSDGWFELSIEPVDEGVFIRSVEITKRKETEEALKISKTTLELFIKYAPAAIAMFDNEMRYIAVSERFIQDYRLPSKDIVGRSHYEVFPEIPERWKQIHQRCLQGNTEKAEADPFLREDGHTDWVRWELRPWYENDKEIGGIVLFSEVITTSRNNAHALRLMSDTQKEIALTHNLEDIYMLVGQRIHALIGGGYIVISMLNDKKQAMQILNLYGFGDNVEKLQKQFNVDVTKRLYPLKDMTEEEITLFRTPGLHKFEHGLYNLLVRKIPQTVCDAVEKLLKLQGIYTISFVQNGQHYGGLTLLTRNDIEPFREVIETIMAQATVAIQRIKANDGLHKQIARLNAMRKIDRSITAGLDMTIALNLILSEVIKQLGVDAAAILLLDPITQQLRYSTSKGFHSIGIQETSIPLGKGLAGKSGTTRKTLYVRELSQEKNIYARQNLFKTENFIEYYSVPLIAKGELKGTLEIFNRSHIYTNKNWTDYLEIIAGQAAITIDNAQLFINTKKSTLHLLKAYDELLEAAASAISQRDNNDPEHTQHLITLTLKLAKKLHVPPKQYTHIQRGILLHLLGTLDAPEKTRHNPTKLRADEWTLIKTYPDQAFSILNTIPELRPAIDIPYCYNESWDGTGYPRGLSGHEIPIAARIFRVVNIWNTLRIDRPYQKAMTDQEALNHIKNESGTRLDPEVVEAFLSILPEE